LPKFSKLIKVSEKNIQAYKKKGEVPNTIAVIAACFASMKKVGIDYQFIIESLELEAKTKKGAGFAKKREKLSKRESRESLYLNRALIFFSISLSDGNGFIM
jgi:hypothetical protein